MVPSDSIVDLHYKLGEKVVLLRILLFDHVDLGLVINFLVSSRFPVNIHKNIDDTQLIAIVNSTPRLVIIVYPVCPVVFIVVSR